MSNVLKTAGVIALLIASASVPAQAQGAPMRGGNPLRIVLEERARLRLTDAQVSRLERIHGDAERKNAPLARQLRDMRDDLREGERAAGAADARKLLAEIRANNDAAWAEARGVLDAEQRRRAEALIRERREQRRGGQGARPSRPVPS